MLGKYNENFISSTSPNGQFLVLIEEIFRRMMKNSLLLDSITDEDQEYDKPIPFKTIEKTVDKYTVKKWLDVLGPVKFISENE